MLSEAKIAIGRDINDYIVLPITVLAKLKKASFVDINTLEPTILSWSKKTKAKTSLLLVNGVPATEPTDGKWLQRCSDGYGLTDFSFIDPC